MKEKLNKLYKLAENNEELGKDLMDLNDRLVKQRVEGFSGIAGKYGIELEEEDFSDGEKLSLEDLDLVAGGDDLTDRTFRLHCQKVLAK